MKKLNIILLFLLLQVSVFACPTCERQQPKILRGVIHGTLPDSNWDYVIVWSIIIISILTLYFSIKWLLRPEEKNKEHIKYFILNNE